MKETRILVVFTGGTIGSAPEAGMLRPAGESARKLLLTYFADEKQKAFEEYFQQKISFDTACPYEILSENLDGNHLERLEACILGKGVENYGGIIVATGTDTLAYSSAAMGYAFANLPIPLVMVSANYSLQDERSNGFSNFEGALLLILEKGHRGVFCSYDNGDEHFIHYATRLLPQMNYSHRVESVMGMVYGRVEGMTIKVEERVVDGKRIKKTEDPAETERVDEIKAEETGTEEIDEEGGARLSCKNLSKRQIAFIRPYPGVVYAVPEGCCGVVLDTYHSGTLPAMGNSFQSFMKKVKKQNIPVFAAGVPEGMTYETVEQMKEEGVIVLPPASPVAMYMKLWMAAGEGMDLCQALFSSIGHDLIS